LASQEEFLISNHKGLDRSHGEASINVLGRSE
jgi:hypothetical protein